MPSGIYQHKKGYKRPPYSEEWKKNMSESKKKKPTNYWLGKKRPEVKGFFTMKGKNHSEETKAKMKGRIAWNKGLKGYRAGAKSHLWKGGVTPENHRIRHSFEYKLWRKSVFERDNFTCIWCFQRGNVEADHIKPFALFPELRFAIDNGRTLCVNCHRKTDTYGEKTKKLSRESFN